jgi:hypothetical protein
LARTNSASLEKEWLFVKDCNRSDSFDEDMV